MSANGALMRTSIIGVIFSNLEEKLMIEKIIKYSTNICKTTHFDPRCIACCICLNIAIGKILNYIKNKKEIDIEKILNESLKIAIENSFKDKNNTNYDTYNEGDKNNNNDENMKKYFNMKTFEEINLSEEKYIGWFY
jgi:ADP-ribosylglycohydrolase